jgi:hypothetical protein
MKLPKTIANHPTVESVHFGDDQGLDYKYWIYLKIGCYFTAGGKAGGTGGGFNTVEAFRQARPIHTGKLKN